MLEERKERQTQVTVTRDETYEEGMQSTSGGPRGENGWRGFQMEPGRINSLRVLRGSLPQKGNDISRVC